MGTGHRDCLRPSPRDMCSELPGAQGCQGCTRCQGPTRPGQALPRDLLTDRQVVSTRQWPTGSSMLSAGDSKDGGRRAP